MSNSGIDVALVFALFVYYPEYIITTKNDVSFCFIDK